MPRLKLTEQYRRISYRSFLLGPGCRYFRHHPLDGRVYPDYSGKQRPRAPENTGCPDTSSQFSGGRAMMLDNRKSGVIMRKRILAYLR